MKKTDNNHPQAVNGMVTAQQRDEAFFVNYYDNISTGERGNFLLVLRIVLGGSEYRWQKRLAAWRKPEASRKLLPYEIQKLTHLTTGDQWRKTLKLIQNMISI